MPVEFTISSKNLYDAGLQVSKCSFHPSEPVLACAIDGGKICLYHKQHTEFKGAAELIVPLSQWNETVLNPVPTQYPVSGISCLQWDVSSCLAWTVWDCNSINPFVFPRWFVLHEHEWMGCLHKVEGKRLAVGYENGTLILWSRDGCRLFERRKHTSRIWSIRWNPILLNVFASGSNDRVINQCKMNGCLARDVFTINPTWLDVTFLLVFFRASFFFIFSCWISSRPWCGMLIRNLHRSSNDSWLMTEIGFTTSFGFPKFNSLRFPGTRMTGSFTFVKSVEKLRSWRSCTV